MSCTTAFGLGSVAYRTVKVGAVDIFYREAGPKSAPVLLMLHGVPTSSRMYQPMLESSLAKKYRLIAPDLSGVAVQSVRYSFAPIFPG